MTAADRNLDAMSEPCETCGGSGKVHGMRRPRPDSRGAVPYTMNCPVCKGAGRLVCVLSGTDVALTLDEFLRLERLATERADGASKEE